MLLIIAALDRLWVHGRISECDAEKVEVGQKVQIVFPFAHHEIVRRVFSLDAS